MTVFHPFERKVIVAVVKQNVAACETGFDEVRREVHYYLFISVPTQYGAVCPVET